MLIIKSKLQTLSMTELYEKAFPPKLPIIDNFLYPGLQLIVGAPKVGKTFFMEQIAYHVSSGIPMWEYAVRMGAVLYLALEDKENRVQERLYRMFGTKVTSNLFFSLSSRTINEGLLNQLQNFIDDHPDTLLIIIDTLQKIRDVEGDAYSYAKDYEFMAKLKEFADNNNICLVLVHHTRKQKSDDNFDRISGTNGLLGAVDGAYIMYKSKRSDSDAIIEVSGRDQADKKYVITRDEKTLCWNLKEEQSSDYDEELEPVLETVGKFTNAENPFWEGTATELVEKLKLDIKPNVLSMKLNVNAGKLYKSFFVKYSNSRTHSGRKITLLYDTNHPVIIQSKAVSEETRFDSDEDQEMDNACLLKQDDTSYNSSNVYGNDEYALTDQMSIDVCLV